MLTSEKELEFDFETLKPSTRELLVRIGGLQESLDLRQVSAGAYRSDFCVSSYPEKEVEWVALLERYLSLKCDAMGEFKPRALEKLEWVEQNGSRYLRKLLAYGYEVDTQYATEANQV